MNQTEYLNQLNRYLKKLPKSDYENAMDYFTEYFEEAGEQRAIAELGTPKEAAAEILYNLLNQAPGKEPSAKNSSSHSFKRTATISFMSILTTPYGLPAALGMMFATLMAAVILDYIDLIIKPSKDQSAYLSYELHCKNNKNPFSYNIKNGCLHLNESNFKEAWITVKNKTTAIKRWKFTTQNYISAVTLYVPSGTTYNNSNIVMNEGDLSINGLHCKKANIKLKYSDVTVKKLSCNNAAITTTDGDITVADLNITGTTSVKTADGDINAPSLAVSGTARISVLDGDINAPNLGISGTLQINTEDGDLNIPNLYTYTSGTVKISTEYGDINASGLNVSGNAQLKSIGGDISLQINKKCLNRLAINMDVTDGEISANKSLHGSKKRRGDGWYYTKKAAKGNAYLKVHTGDGDISIR